MEPQQQQQHVKDEHVAQPPTSSAPPYRTLSASLPTPPQTPQMGDNESQGDKLQVANTEEQLKGQTKLSLDSVSSRRSKKEYMDSLVPPSNEEMSRISEVQLQREQEEKRKSREKEKKARKSLDVSRASLDIEEGSRHGAIFSHHKKMDSTNKRRSRHSSIVSAAVASATAAGTEHDLDDILRHRAATLIQRTYRGYRTRREIKGLGLDANTRWTHALREMKFREITTPRSRWEEGSTAVQDRLDSPEAGDEAARKSRSARYKWRKAAIIAGRAAQDMDNDDDTSSSISDSDLDSNLSTAERRKKESQNREEAKAQRRKDAQMMGLQYFLEMVDLKHRYGSNLRTYHEEWKKADTNENFFYWLDYGEGRKIDMASCPRERLDREQVRYLSREERQYYLVTVDSEGRLCWAKNGARIDTTEKWKDGIRGIVPVDDPTPAFQPKMSNSNQPEPFLSEDSSPRSSHSTSDTSESELEAARAAKYASPGFTDAKGYKKVTHLSVSTIFNTLLRKSVRKNTWIFVADTNFRLYVGIKDSGAFQHSSFLQGSRLSAAGLIKIKNGRLSSLSPLSGHYRPPASNFRAFVHSLKEEGVDMSHVSISKSYTVLVGLEMYIKTRKKGKELFQKLAHKKDKVLHPEEVLKREEDERDKSESAEKERQFLERQAQEKAEEEEKKKEENRSAVKVMQKLGITPVVPEEQEGEPEAEKAEDVRTASDAAATAGGTSAEPAADEKHI